MNGIVEKTKQAGILGRYACSHPQGNEGKWREQGFEISTTTYRFVTELGNELSISNLIHSSDGSVRCSMRTSAHLWVKICLHRSMLHIWNLLTCTQLAFVTPLKWAKGHFVDSEYNFCHQYNLHKVDEIQNWSKHDTYTKLLYVLYENTVWRKLMHDTSVTSLTTVTVMKVQYVKADEQGERELINNT